MSGSLAWRINGLLQPAFLEVTEGVNSSVSEEGPVSPRGVDQRQIARHDNVGFGIVRRLGYDVAIGIGQKTATPEFNLTFDPHAIRRGNEEAVRDRMAAHHCLPCRILTRSVNFPLAGYPANRSRIK